jgi:hypothetical protein
MTKEPSQDVMEEAPSSYKIPISIKNAAARKKTVFDHLLKGALLVTETAFFILCGAIMIALDSFGKFLKTFYQTPARSKIQVQKPPSQKIKVPILPIDHYNQLEEGEILKRLDGLSKEKLEILRGFEATNQNRKAIIEAIDRLLGMDH